VYSLFIAKRYRQESAEADLSPKAISDSRDFSRRAIRHLLRQEINMVRVQNTRLAKAAFSLIELLVVIAIIALLAAIIFPVFEQIEENSRQSTSISNMHDISTKLEQYKLDAHHYPPVLFGYAVPASGGKGYVSMDQALSACTAQQTCGTYLTGLYPEYIDNVAEFHDPDDASQVTDAKADSAPDGTASAAGGDIVKVSHLFLCSGNDSTVVPVANGPCGSTNSGDADDCACPKAPPTAPAPTNPPATINPMGIGVLVQASGYLKNNPGQPYPLNAYYAADSYDVSPRLASGSSLDLLTVQPAGGPDEKEYNYVVRYQPSWTTISENLDCNTTAANGGIALSQGLCPANSDDNLYLNQLRWRNPPSSAYVTSTTWHVKGPGTNVLILTEDGSVQKFDASRFAAMEPPTSGGATTPPNMYPLNVNANGVTTAKFWQVTHQ